MFASRFLFFQRVLWLLGWSSTSRCMSLQPTPNDLHSAPTNISINATQMTRETTDRFSRAGLFPRGYTECSYISGHPDPLTCDDAKFCNYDIYEEYGVGCCTVEQDHTCADEALPAVTTCLDFGSVQDEDGYPPLVAYQTGRTSVW